MALLRGRNGGSLIDHEEIESSAKRGKRAAQFMAQARHEQAKLGFIIVSGIAHAHYKPPAFPPLRKARSSRDPFLNASILPIDKNILSNTAAPPSKGERIHENISARRSGNHNLIREQGMPIGQIENRLMSNLLRVVGPRSALKHDAVFRADNVEVANSTIGDAIDMALNVPGKLAWLLEVFRPREIGVNSRNRHARLPF
jgi:hypothetical protein